MFFSNFPPSVLHMIVYIYKYCLWKGTFVETLMILWIQQTPAVTFLMKNVKHFIIFISYNVYDVFLFLKLTVIGGIAVVQA